MGELGVLCNNIVHVVNTETAVNLFVYRENGCKAACADTTTSGERELSVRGTFVTADSENLLELVIDVARALNVASSSETYGNVVATLGRE